MEGWGDVGSGRVFINNILGWKSLILYESRPLPDLQTPAHPHVLRVSAEEWNELKFNKII